MGKKTEVLFLSEPDMIEAGVLDHKRCVDVIDEAFKLLGQGDYIMGGPSGNEHGQMISFPKEPKFEGMPADGPDRRFMAMLAYLGGRFHVCGEKWYGSNIVNPQRGLPRSVLTVVLNDPDTCEPMAIMSGNLLSAMRTGAVPGVGTKYLAREGAEVCACIGAGPIGKACLKGISAKARNLKKIAVYDIKKETSLKFIEWAKEELGLEGVAVESLQEALALGDINSFATSSLFPIPVKYEWLKKGSLSILTGGACFDEETTVKGHVVFDNPIMHQVWCFEPMVKDHLDAWSSWYKLCLEGKGTPIEQQIGLGKIACGEIPGRTNDDEVFVLQTGGMPIEDVAWGMDLYESAKAKGLGTMLKFWDSPHWS